MIARTEASLENADRPSNASQSTDLLITIRRTKRRMEHLARVNPNMRIASLAMVNCRGCDGSVLPIAEGMEPRAKPTLPTLALRVPSSFCPKPFQAAARIELSYLNPNNCI